MQWLDFPYIKALHHKGIQGHGGPSSTHLQGGLISLWLYKENNKLRD
jgi:hypothetical protein